MRICHIMKKNHKSETPHRAIWVKLQTTVKRVSLTETNYVLDFGWLAFGRRETRTMTWALRWYRFETCNGFWRLLNKLPEEKTRTYIIVDNSNQTLALLDVFTQAYKRGWECTQAVFSNPPTIIRWRKDSVSLHLIDSANVFSGMTHMTPSGVGDSDSCDKHISITDSADDVRVKHGALTMHRSFVRWWDFLRLNDLGGFSTTLGAQALRTFRHKYMKHPILVDTNREALALARAGYHGGRTECLHIGRLQGEFFLLDVNSMYAAVMRDMLVPTKLICYTKRCDLRDIASWIKDRVVVAECEVETEEPIYAVKHNDQLVFPIGRFSTVLAGNEVAYALRHGHIRKVVSAAVYSAAVAFQEFVDAMWKERRAAFDGGDHDAANKWKCLLASFYGKWGQKGGAWEKIDDAPNGKIKSWANVDHETGEFTQYRQFGGIIQQYIESDETSQSLPAIAACITANARVVLYQMMCEAGMENVYYVDTDSLLVNVHGFERIKDYIKPDALGGLRLEGTYRDCHIFASKDYVFGNRTRRKGVSSNAHVITDSEFDQEHVKSVASMFRGGDMSKARTTRVRKHLTRTYSKGIVASDGRVTPITLGG